MFWSVGSTGGGRAGQILDVSTKDLGHLQLPNRLHNRGAATNSSSIAESAMNIRCSKSVIR